MELLLLLLGDNLRRVGSALVIWVLDRRSLLGALERAHHVLLFAGDRGDASAPWRLENIETMMSHNHELGQGRVAEDGVVREVNVGDIEINELRAVVVALAKGDREADLPYGDGGAIGHP